MQKRLVWLLVATLVTLGAIGTANAHPKAGYGPISTVHNSYCDPASRDRHTAPDKFPHNIVKVLRTTNKAQTNSYVPVVYTFKNNNPFNVIRFLRRPVQLEEGVLYTFVHPDGDKGKALFIVPEYMADSLLKTCKQLDTAGLTTSSGTKRYYRQLDHRRASLTDADFIGSIESFSTGTGSRLIVDEVNNALYFEDAPSGAVCLDAALTDWMDVPTAMVQMMVKIYEIDAYNDASIGLDYFAWKNGPGADLFSLGGYKEYGSVEHSYNAGLPTEHFANSGHYYTYNYHVNSAFFDFLATKGKARVMNEAKLAALNTWTASLSSGDQILYYPTGSDYISENIAGAPATATNVLIGYDADGDPIYGAPGFRTPADVIYDHNNFYRPITQAIDSVGTGLSVEITPIIGESQVNLDIDLSWSDYTALEGNGTPVINERSVSSSVRLDLGDEIVIGGMKRDREVKSTKKIPVLGSLPILGYLFGGEGVETQSTEMVVAIAPNAIMDFGAFSIDAADQSVIATATSGDVDYDEIEFGFDQMLLDEEYGLTSDDLE